jgi:hypothetical protein
MLVRAARSSFPRPWLFAAGVGAAAALYTNLVWLPLLGLLLPGYAMLCRRFHGKLVTSNLDTQLVMMFCGAATLTATLALVNRSVGGPLWFYRPSIEFAISLAGQENPWKIPLSKWYGHAYWLIWPACAAIGSVVYLAIRQLRTAAESDSLAFGWWPVNYLGFAFLFAFESWRGSPLLQFSHYVSYLIGPIMLAAGTLLASPLSRLSRPAVGAVIGLVVASAALCVLRTGYAPIKVSLLCALIGFVGLGLQLPSRWFTAYFVAVLSFASALSTPYPIGNAGSLPHINRCSLLSNVTTAAQYIDDVTRARRAEGDRAKVWFWYDADEPFGQQHTSLASLWLWGYSLINDKYPTWSQPGYVLAPGDLVVIPSQQPDVIARAVASWGDPKVTLRFLDARSVGKFNGQFTVTVFVLEARR